MKYDFETIIDRDPAIRGTGKYRIMKDSKGNKPPKGIVPLSVADMEFRTAPCVIDAIKAEADFGVLGYHRLTDSFRESCCQWMKTRHDWDVQPDWIVPFEQVVPALYNAVWTFTQPGDGILIQTPDYHHFTGATVNTGRKVLENRLVADEKGHYTVDFDDREKAKQAKLFFLCSPQNPTGRVWTEEELRRMGEICNEYGVMVVADEIHHDLIQPGYKHIVYASLGKEFADNCVICTSLSKTWPACATPASSSPTTRCGPSSRSRWASRPSCTSSASAPWPTRPPTATAPSGWRSSSRSSRATMSMSATSSPSTSPELWSPSWRAPTWSGATSAASA